ncbi:hypothetical protein VUR80DRAFT_3064 [Thermomyces stellatus]
MTRGAIRKWFNLRCNSHKTLRCLSVTSLCLPCGIIHGITARQSWQSRPRQHATTPCHLLRRSFALQPLQVQASPNSQDQQCSSSPKDRDIRSPGLMATPAYAKLRPPVSSKHTAPSRNRHPALTSPIGHRPEKHVLRTGPQRSERKARRQAPRGEGRQRHKSGMSQGHGDEHGPFHHRQLRRRHGALRRRARAAPGKGERSGRGSAGERGVGSQLRLSCTHVSRIWVGRMDIAGRD